MPTLSTITQPPTTETYDSLVSRTISSPIEFPYELNDLCLDEVFYQASNINPILSNIYDNVQSIIQLTKIYNSVYPISTHKFTEYNITGINGVYFNDSYEILFNQTKIDIYQDGSLLTALTNTSYGDFLNIKDVVIHDNTLYILDGNFILLLDASDNFSFITFFGGLGDNTTQYNFNNPQKIIIDQVGGHYLIYQSNGYVKKYSIGFNDYISGRQLTNSIDVDLYNSVYYTLESDKVNITYSDETTSSFNHELDDVLGILYDRTQNGFLWIRTENGIYKFTVDGLYLGSYSGLSGYIKDLDRNGYINAYIDDNGLCFGLDYSFTTDLLGSNVEQINPLSSVEINCDELAWDGVINDSLNKLYENIEGINQSLSSQYVSTFENDSTLSGVSLENVTVDSCEFDCNFFFGRNEVVNCHSWNRVMGGVYDTLIKIRNRMFGVERFIDIEDVDYSDTVGLSSFFNETVDGQDGSDLEPQLFNPSKTPLSVEEICNNPALSGVFG